MIKVTVFKTKSIINKIDVSGHSGYANKGQDIVCAGVSAVTIGTLNAIHEITGKVPEHELDEQGFASIKFNKSNQEQLIAQVCIIQLKSIVENYKKYVVIAQK